MFLFILISLSNCADPLCAIDCIWDNCKCVKNTSDAICYPIYKRVCPSGCSFAGGFTGCIPLYPTSICGSIGHTSICPIGCAYYDGRCLSSDPSIVCYYRSLLFCPKAYVLNPRGDICLDTNGLVFNLTDSCHINYEVSSTVIYGIVLILVVILLGPRIYMWWRTSHQME